jgi:hypothetical protein
VYSLTQGTSAIILFKEEVELSVAFLTLLASERLLLTVRGGLGGCFSFGCSSGGGRSGEGFGFGGGSTGFGGCLFSET